MLSLQALRHAVNRGKVAYDEDHEAFRDSCSAFLAKHVEPNLEKYLEDKALPREFWLAAGAEGYLGLEIPEEFGGAELLGNLQA